MGLPTEVSSSDILQKYPEYASTSVLDDLRTHEYNYLDDQGHIYLDYTGSGLAARSQLKAHQERLAATTFGNPHSSSPTSLSSTKAIESTRRRVLEFFNASPEEYAVIFTPNATGAARLVAEAYPFKKGMRFVHTADNHNSIVGFREYARRAGVRSVTVPLQDADLRVSQSSVVEALAGGLRKGWGRGKRPGSAGLFAYPAQSNFSGVQHPLEWVTMAQEQGYQVLLDTAAYIPTNRLDLSKVKPDFMLASWYKLFGFPTGVGCLIARHDALSRLCRPWFSGGTVLLVTVARPWHKLLDGVAAFEDGTVNFLSIPDVRYGLDWISNIGMDTIHTRVKCLTGYFLDRLHGLRHSSGKPMAVVYGPQTTESRGGTVCFNILDAEGKGVDERIVDADSAEAGISLRTGCFCNPGVGEVALRFEVPRFPLLFHLYKHKNSFRSRNDKRSGKSWSPDDAIMERVEETLRAIRVSFGLASNVADVDKFIAFVESYRDRAVSADGLPSRGGC